MTLLFWYARAVLKPGHHYGQRRTTIDKPTGEIGTLEQVIVHELLDNKIFLFILFQGFRYMGFMSFDDLTFCSQIHALLKANIGLSIKEIGDMDFPETS